MVDTKKKNIEKADKSHQKAKVIAKESRARVLLAEVGRIRSETHLVGGFMTFIRQQGIVALAIGLAIGTQANATVKSFVDGMVTPIVSFLLGSHAGLVNEKWYLVGHSTKTTHYLLEIGSRQLVLGWGQVLSSLITLLVVATVIYLVIKGLRLDKVDMKKP